jgi:MYXO-CTERM domain-containing protein
MRIFYAMYASRPRYLARSWHMTLRTDTGTADVSLPLLLLLLLLLLLYPVLRRRRQWDGTNGMRNWGGPGVNGRPGPECRSCFKDGISFAPNEAPQGFQTDELGPLDPTSFLDAAMVFTDRTIRGNGQPAVVVLFRWAAMLLQDTAHGTSDCRMQHMLQSGSPQPKREVSCCALVLLPRSCVTALHLHLQYSGAWLMPHRMRSQHGVVLT